MSRSSSRSRRRRLRIAAAVARLTCQTTALGRPRLPPPAARSGRCGREHGVGGGRRPAAREAGEERRVGAGESAKNPRRSGHLITAKGCDCTVVRKFRPGWSFEGESCPRNCECLVCWRGCRSERWGWSWSRVAAVTPPVPKAARGQGSPQVRVAVRARAPGRGQGAAILRPAQQVRCPSAAAVPLRQVRAVRALGLRVELAVQA